MTRMWSLPPTYLCDDHLLGEHSEMHQEAGTLENHDHGLAVVRGHAKLAQFQLSRCVDRHDELAAELDNRGFDHDSPLDYDLDSYDDVGYIDRHANLVDLYQRCDDCADRIERHGGIA
jgi:hypothetical protein